MRFTKEGASAFFTTALATCLVAFLVAVVKLLTSFFCWAVAMRVRLFSHKLLRLFAMAVVRYG